SAPPMRLVKFGAGDAEVHVGGETVMFRHEEKFRNPTAIAVTLSDSLDGDALKQRVEAIGNLQFERIGQHIQVNAIAVINDSGKSAEFALAAEAAKAAPLALVLVTDSPEAMSAAVEKVADARPLLSGATAESADAMAKLAKEKACPLAVQADSPEALAELAEKVKAAGVEDIVLLLRVANPWDEMQQLTRIRAIALKKNFRPLGYPVIAFATEGDDFEQSARAASLICKYAAIVVIRTTEPYAVLPLLTTRMNIYTDPQKPVQVEPRIYAVGEPSPDSPMLFTTNFSLTYYTVEADVEASRIPAYILVVDTEGTSVLTAYSGDKLNEKTVGDAMKKFEAEKLVNHKKLIIPGFVAVMSGKLEEETGWEIMVGPRESAVLPKYLQEVWPK
ncbi:MAG: acetyl-CoA decarbonylase/synthase complex subunit gamma, partial [Planctomycetia bacterium]|nr:acetyl-CoA decarbonylase/synthase complex subunit gamma [Planctomycetia bacterium]